jgi:hypothetical protein
MFACVPWDDLVANKIAVGDLALDVFVPSSLLSLSLLSFLSRSSTPTMRPSVAILNKLDCSPHFRHRSADYRFLGLGLIIPRRIFTTVSSASLSPSFLRSSLTHTATQSCYCFSVTCWPFLFGVGITGWSGILYIHLSIMTPADYMSTSGP